MEQPTFVNRVRQWYKVRRGLRTTQPLSLRLVELQERFGPSALTGLADATTLVACHALAAPLETVSAIPPQSTPRTQTEPAPTTSKTYAPRNELTQEASPEFQLQAERSESASEAIKFDAPEAIPNANTSAPTATGTATSSASAISGALPATLPTASAAFVATPVPTVPVSVSPETHAPTKETPTQEVPVHEIPPQTIIPTDELPVEEVPVEEVLVDKGGIVDESMAWPEAEESIPPEEWPTFEGMEPPTLEMDYGDFPLTENMTGDKAADPLTPSNPLTTTDPKSRLETTNEVTKVTVSTNSKSESTPATTAESFRISRSSADGTALQVSYQLAAYQGGSVVQQEGTATIPGGAKHVDVAATVKGMNGRPELVTLTVHASGSYQSAQPTATLNGFGEVTSDAALFAAFRHGPSQLAFQQLVDRHQPGVLRTAFQILGNRSDAEDISQLVFLALARQEMTIHSSLQYWLQKVTRNASIALLRAKSRRLRHENENAKPAESPSIEIIHELQDELQVAMERLPGHLSEAVRLRYIEGWTQQEAAAIVGCPRGTLSQRASQGLQSLREMLVADLREAS